MNTSSRMKNSLQWVYLLEMFLYTFLLVLLQADFFVRLPYPALRADILLPLVVGVAAQWSPVPSLLWACVWGYALDTLSGEFWGLHVGSYVVAISMVNIASEKFDFHNPVYQMCLVGLCALGQSLALGLYVSFEPAGLGPSATIWTSLLIRSVLIMVLAPFIIMPVSWMGRRAR